MVIGPFRPRLMDDPGVSSVKTFDDPGIAIVGIPRCRAPIEVERNEHMIEVGRIYGDIVQVVS